MGYQGCAVKTETKAFSASSLLSKHVLSGLSREPGLRALIAALFPSPSLRKSPSYALIGQVEEITSGDMSTLPDHIGDPMFFAIMVSFLAERHTCAPKVLMLAICTC